MKKAKTKAKHIIKLYKFRPLANEEDYERLKGILETGKFWCSTFPELNDPMEGVFYGQKEDVGVIYNEKNKYKICSFSYKEAFEDPAMWGYYANGFKGMAIKIEVNKSNVKIIDYVNEIPSLEDLPVDNKIVKILTTKSTPWTKEAEYRFLKKSEINFHKVGKITGVYFGNPYGDVANRREIETKSESLSEYIKFKEKLIKFAKVKGIKVYHVKIEGCKVKEARIALPAKNR